MKLTKTSGSVLAATAAAFILSGPVTTITAKAAGTTVHCFGVNSCKGQSACKSGNHGCKGQNSCKGQGYVDLSKADCAAKKGKIVG